MTDLPPSRPRVSERLPAAVQTGLAAVRARADAAASARGDAVVDLSIGAPTDPTPDVVQRALATEGNAPGYPLTVGRRDLREAYVAWLERAHGVIGLDQSAVLPVIGTKELIGSLPLHLGLGADALVGRPTLAYPTYAVGAALVGASTVTVDGLADLEARYAEGRRPDLLWVNSPSNPTGRVLDAAELTALVALAREHGTLLVSDECYLDLGWEAEPVSVLRADVCGGSHAGLLAVHSLSKRSNLAGYRCGFVSGDADLVAELAVVRRNLGLQVPSPQQGVAIAALDDDEHVSVQRARYAARRDVLRTALDSAGFRIDHSEAGLYLWVTRDEPAAVTVDRFADLGIVVVSGREYAAEAGDRHVRIALTAPDTDVARGAALITKADWNP